MMKNTKKSTLPLEIIATYDFIDFREKKKYEGQAINILRDRYSNVMCYEIYPNSGISVMYDKDSSVMTYEKYKELNKDILYEDNANESDNNVNCTKEELENMVEIYFNEMKEIGYLSVEKYKELELAVESRGVEIYNAQFNSDIQNRI